MAHLSAGGLTGRRPRSPAVRAFGIESPLIRWRSALWSPLGYQAERTIGRFLVSASDVRPIGYPAGRLEPVSWASVRLGHNRFGSSRDDGGGFLPHRGREPIRATGRPGGDG